ncbi:MAG: BTAD domain-containing putative transcriptional regulator [Peptostreptococcaceae bacterium]|nr:BTAD domain-containing putative transcriptional regulator [Peptostreptococcaceae bacterium]
MAKKQQSKIKIQTFGFFDLLIDDESAIQNFGSSKKTLALFKYFVAHTNDKLPTHKIMEANFSEYNYSDPGNTLRGHIHRLRAVLNALNKQVGFKAFSVDYVADYYIFTVSKNCSIDFIEFLSLIKEEPTTETISGRERLERVKELYRGNFLQDSEGLEWVKPIRFDMRKKFSRYIDSILEDLYEQGEYNEALLEADSVMEKLFFEEDFQEIYLKVMIALEKTQEAIDHFDFMSQRFQSEKGILPSEKLSGLFKRIAEMTESISSTDFFTIEKKLRQTEAGTNNGVFVSSKEFFMDLYRLEVRRKKRHGDRITSVGIVNIATADFRDMKREEIKTVQDELTELISKTIRAQDVMTILNDSQIAFMLFDALDTTVVDVDDRMKEDLNRIKEQYKLVITINYKTITAGNEFSGELTL